MYMRSLFEQEFCLSARCDKLSAPSFFRMRTLKQVAGVFNGIHRVLVLSISLIHFFKCVAYVSVLFKSNI